MRKSWRSSTRGIANRLAELALLALLIAPALARAQDVAPPRIVQMSYAGEPGAWVPIDALREMLADVEHSADLEHITKLQHAQLDVRAQRAAELQAAAENARDAAKKLDAALEQESKARQNAEDELDAWYRSPVLLLVTGAVVGGVIVAVAGSVGK